MNILVIGGGGREHALTWKVAQSSRFEHVFVTPGNAGTAQIATNLAIDATDINAVTSAVDEHKIELVLIGGETHLALGFADQLRVRGVAVFGPNQNATQLESSKVWAKQFMRKYQIPTANFEVVRTIGEADDFIASHTPDSYVIKADGLAAGKGVFLPTSTSDATETAQKFFNQGHTALVMEDRIAGRECSVFAFVSGDNFSELVAACDYKTLNETTLARIRAGWVATPLLIFWILTS